MGNDAEFVGGGVGSCRTCRTCRTGPTCLTGLTCLTCPTGLTGLTDLMCPTILLFTRHFSLLDNPKSVISPQRLFKAFSCYAFLRLCRLTTDLG